MQQMFEKYSKNLSKIKKHVFHTKPTIQDIKIIRIIGRGSFSSVKLVYLKDYPKIPLTLKVLEKNILRSTK